MRTFPDPYHPARHPTTKRSFHRSAGFAWRGIRVAFRHEPNVKRQLSLGVLAVGVSVLLHVPMAHVAMVILTAAAVMIVELINSAIESLADAVHPHYHDKIRDAKDMSAGAVLLMSFAAVAVGLVILLPPLLELLAG